MPCIRVNKLIGDLHTWLLEQGSNKVILAFSPPFSIVSSKEALENVNLWRATLRSSERSNPDRRVHIQLRILTKSSPSLLGTQFHHYLFTKPANIGASECFIRAGAGVCSHHLPAVAVPVS